MSNCKDHLRWCFQEDQIKFDSPNEMLAEDYLTKARETLEVTDLLEKSEYYDWSVTAAYYARYFALTALLRRCGLVVENHACAISLFEFVFVRQRKVNEKLLNSIKKGKSNRVEKQYGITRTTDTTAEEQRENAIDFVTELTAYLEGISSNTINQVRKVIRNL